MGLITRLNLPACARSNPCALASILHDLRCGADEDIEALERERWAGIVQDAEESGDGLDYDGPLHTWG